MKSILFPVAIVLSFALLSPFAIISAFITGSGNIAHTLGTLWSRIILWFAGVRLHISGQENIPKDEPVVFACNHASQVDIPILYLALPVQFRFIVKKELFNIPVFGLAMRKTGYIPVDRSGGRASLISIKQAAEKVRKGISVVVFPEGTRSHDGRLGDFKVGGLLVAIKAKCPVIPVAISGSYKILPRGRIKPQGGDVEVCIGKPRHLEDQKNIKSKEELVKEIREAVSGMLKN